MLLDLPVANAEVSKLLEGTVTQPIVDLLQPFLIKASYVAMAIILLYAFQLLYRIYAERQKLKLLDAIRYDLDHLNLHYRIPHSRERKGLFGKMWYRIKSGQQYQK